METKLAEFIEAVMDSNYFTFDRKFYKQAEVMAMCSKFAPIFAMKLRAKIIMKKWNPKC